MRSKSMGRATWDPQTDRYWGPFTYNAAPKSYHPIGVMFASAGDEEDESRCNLRISGFGRTLIVSLPPIIKPWRCWVDTSRYEWSKSPQGGYWDLHRREYGFSLSRSGGVGEGAYDFLSVHLGPQTHDSSTTKLWSKHLPWASWRHVRRSLYGLNGQHVWTEPQSAWKLGDGSYEARKAAEDACPSRTFAFKDFDGEALTARTRIEEREWRAGEGWFKWLSLFKRPMIHRSLDIEFSGETGKRKGSWKGGTLGHGIRMLPSELHAAAFRRYCAENGMTFVGEVADAGKGFR